MTQSDISRPRSRKSGWSLPLAILLSAVFLFLALRGISWNELKQAVAACRWVYLIPAAAAGIVNFWLRSQRWGILLRARQRVSPMVLFWTSGAGYLGNNFLPFRSGEVIRSFALGQKTGISKAYVLTTAITERVLDAVFLVLLVFILIPTIGQLPTWLPPTMRGLGLISLVAMLVLLFAPRMERQILNLFARLPVPQSWRPRLLHILRQFIQGAASLLHPGRAGLFLLLTILIWLLDGVGMMASAQAFSIDLQLHQSLLLLAALGLSSAIPSAPGYVGVYQFAAVTTLAIFGIAKSQALAFILVAQAVGMLLTLVWGLAGLWRLGIQLNQAEQI